jgi:dienelactone hydrolase
MKSQDVLEDQVRLRLEEVELEGGLAIPRKAESIVIFAHGSGSSRFSPRNRFVASELNKRGLATLLFDLLTPNEEKIDLQTRELRFNIKLLASRVVGAVDWVRNEPRTLDLSIGLFGASTGAAAALMAAAKRPEVVDAVVSRGGRPDLSKDALPHVRAATLLIVGGRDETVIELNQLALRELNAIEQDLAIVEGATHLFEEPGKLNEVSRLAGDWFLEHLLGANRTRS